MNVVLEIDGELELAAFRFETPAVVHNVGAVDGHAIRGLGPVGFGLWVTSPSDRVRAMCRDGQAHEVKATADGQVLTVPVRFTHLWTEDNVDRIFGSRADAQPAPAWTSAV
jgi:hypothetical protein